MRSELSVNLLPQSLQATNDKGLEFYKRNPLPSNLLIKKSDFYGGKGRKKIDKEAEAVFGGLRERKAAKSELKRISFSGCLV